MPSVEHKKNYGRLVREKSAVEKITLLDRDFDLPEEAEHDYRRWREKVDVKLEREQ